LADVHGDNGEVYETGVKGTVGLSRGFTYHVRARRYIVRFTGAMALHMLHVKIACSHLQ